MKFNTVTANLMTEDVNETIDFYQDVFGFEIVMSVPEKGPFDWVWIKLDEVNFMFQARTEKDLPRLKDMDIGGSMTFFITVEDIRALYAKVENKAEIIMELHDTFYGKTEFTMLDNNGYLLTFAEDTK